MEHEPRVGAGRRECVILAPQQVGESARPMPRLLDRVLSCARCCAPSARSVENAPSETIPHEDRTVLIEDQSEARIDNPNLVRFEARRAQTPLCQVASPPLRSNTRSVVGATAIAQVTTAEREFPKAFLG